MQNYTQQNDFSKLLHVCSVYICATYLLLNTCNKICLNFLVWVLFGLHLHKSKTFPCDLLNLLKYHKWPEVYNDLVRPTGLLKYAWFI